MASARRVGSFGHRASKIAGPLPSARYYQGAGHLEGEQSRSDRLCLLSSQWSSVPPEMLTNAQQASKMTGFSSAPVLPQRFLKR